MTARESDLRARFQRAGQAHVFDGWGGLDDLGRRHLLEQLEGVDLPLVREQGKLFEAHGEARPMGEIAPPDLFPLKRTPEQAARARAARARGEARLAEGKVGYVLVAGGQASRLGYDGPKGAFPVGPVSGRTLFELHARRLRAARRRYGADAFWYVMTSPANDAATRRFFAEHDGFGLDPEHIVFFSQAMNPALDFQGRILMKAPGELFLAPNGHGGALLAMREHGVLDHARERGIEEFSYFQVDNPLARPADPLFVGLHVEAGAGMSTKVVAKANPSEKVGVLGKIDGQLGCIEYSDLPEELRGAREASGELTYRAGNIALHMIARAFVEQLTEGGLKLPWHVAEKTMLVSEGGRTVERQGAKFETFVFDALGQSPASVTLEVDRGLEFSPVKNASGEDSPATARAHLCRLHAGWAAAAGLPLPNPGADEIHPVEVCPLVAEDETDFLERRGIAPIATEKGHLYT
jgi:UDP-N-acetylglucosamine/UDP-N-acetylgalactosamine diphosphorylase